MSWIVRVLNYVLFIGLLIGSMMCMYKLGRLNALIEVVEPIAAPTY